MTRVLALAATIVVLDQITKAVAVARLIPGHPHVLADGWLSLTLVMNPGLAFGLLGEDIRLLHNGPPPPPAPA